MTTTETRTQVTSYTKSGSESHDFGLVDKKGRKLGARVFFATFVLVEMTEEAKKASSYSFRREAAGTYLEVTPQATRDGNSYGACQRSQRFMIENGDEVAATAKRDAWVAKYLKGAKARQVKNAV